MCLALVEKSISETNRADASMLHAVAAVLFNA
mgnify:CR=1 FL=1